MPPCPRCQNFGGHVPPPALWRRRLCAWSADEQRRKQKHVLSCSQLYTLSIAHRARLTLLHCVIAAAQCIVIGPVCGFVCGCWCLWSWVCGSVTTITRNCVHRSSPNWVCSKSWLKFGRPAPPGRGLQRGEKFWLRLTTASAQCLSVAKRFFSLLRLCCTCCCDITIPRQSTPCRLNIIHQFHLWPSTCFGVVLFLSSGVNLPSNMGVSVGQDMPLNCFRCLEKLFSHSIFDTILSSFMVWNLQCYPTTFWMKECDIVRGIKTYSKPSYIFSVGQDPNSKVQRSWLLHLSPDKMLFLQQVGGLHRHLSLLYQFCPTLCLSVCLCVRLMLVVCLKDWTWQSFWRSDRGIILVFFWEPYCRYKIPCGTLVRGEVDIFL